MKILQRGKNKIQTKWGIRRESPSPITHSTVVPSTIFLFFCFTWIRSGRYIRRFQVFLFFDFLILFWVEKIKQKWTDREIDSSTYRYTHTEKKKKRKKKPDKELGISF
jgi:hypothetical protein